MELQREDVNPPWLWEQGCFESHRSYCLRRNAKNAVTLFPKAEECCAHPVARFRWGTVQIGTKHFSVLCGTALSHDLFTQPSQEIHS